MKNLFILLLVLNVFFLMSCQQEDLMEIKQSELFLKSAEVGEIISVNYFNEETAKMDTFQYPKNVLFLVENKEAKVLNVPVLKVEDFMLLTKDEAIFKIFEISSRPTVGVDGPGQKVSAKREIIARSNVTANLLPFSVDDYGQQGEGILRFNGLLRADHYVIAVNIEANKIMIYDLNSGTTLTAKVTVKDNTLSSDLGTLQFVQTSPAGSIFEFSTGVEKYTGYTMD